MTIMVTITKLPPGKARGADDLQRWGTRRLAGRSGVHGQSHDDYPVQVIAEIKDETTKAWKLFDGVIHAWVPKSLTTTTDNRIFTMPSWLRDRKALGKAKLSTT
jgi:hypothetical protein